MLNDMMSRKYDSYGYDTTEAFVTLEAQKKLKYPSVKYVAPELTELKSFFTEAGHGTVDLVEPDIAL